MAKERDEGFRYCSQDTDTFFDPKIRMLLASHGCAGYAVWDYIKLAAYREHGYYVEWDECRAELACADLGISPEKIGLIIDYLLRRSLLCCIERKTCTSRSGVKVLTSHGIQKRFQRMARDAKRTYAVDREIWLLSEDETLDCVKGTKKTDFSGKSNDNSGKMGSDSGINATKENKRNIPPTPQKGDGRAADFDRFWKAYPRKVGKQAAIKAFVKIRDVPLDTLLSAIEAHKRSEQWQRDGGQYIPHPATWLNGRRWEDDLTTEAQQANYDASILARCEQKSEKVKKRVTNSHMEIGTLCKYLQSLDLSACRALYLLHLSDKASNEGHFINRVRQVVPQHVEVIICAK